MRQRQLGLGHTILCAERAVGDDPFAVLLADDFLMYGVLVRQQVRAFEISGKTQLSIMEVNGPDISKYGVVVPKKGLGSVSALVKNRKYTSTIEFSGIGRYVLTPNILISYVRNQLGLMEKFKWPMPLVYKRRIILLRLLC